MVRRLLFLSLFLVPLIATSATTSNTLEVVTQTSGSINVYSVTGRGIQNSGGSHGVVTYVCDWTSNASGAAAVTLPQTDGRIIKVFVNPSDGSTSPTTLYDVGLYNGEDDLFGGNAQNLSQSANKTFIPLITDTGTHAYFPMPINCEAELEVTAAGANKQGRVEITIER